MEKTGLFQPIAVKSPVQAQWDTAVQSLLAELVRKISNDFGNDRDISYLFQRISVSSNTALVITTISCCTRALLRRTDAIVQWLACSTTGHEVVGSSHSAGRSSRVATVGQLLFAPLAWAYSTLHPLVVGTR